MVELITHHMMPLFQQWENIKMQVLCWFAVTVTTYSFMIYNPAYDLSKRVVSLFWGCRRPDADSAFDLWKVRLDSISFFVCVISLYPIQFGLRLVYFSLQYVAAL